jgi:hypothetical protein
VQRVESGFVRVSEEVGHAEINGAVEAESYTTRIDEK